MTQHSTEIQTLVEVADLGPPCLIVARRLAARAGITEAFERAWLKHIDGENGPPTDHRQARDG